MAPVKIKTVEQESWRILVYTVTSNFHILGSNIASTLRNIPLYPPSLKRLPKGENTPSHIN